MALPYGSKHAKRARARVGKMLDGATLAAIKAIQPAFLNAGNRVADTMRSLAESSRDTGALIDSIVVTPGGQETPKYSQPGGNYRVPETGVAITAGNDAVRYPHLVEFGTTTAPAQPFFWPAFRLERKKALATIKRAIRKAIRDGAKSGA